MTVWLKIDGGSAPQKSHDSLWANKMLGFFSPISFIFLIIIIFKIIFLIILYWRASVVSYLPYLLTTFPYLQPALPLQLHKYQPNMMKGLFKNWTSLIIIYCF